LNVLRAEEGDGEERAFGTKICGGVIPRITQWLSRLGAIQAAQRHWTS
jgi:hypothetical protein